MKQAMLKQPHLLNGLNVHKGYITHKAVHRLVKALLSRRGGGPYLNYLIKIKAHFPAATAKLLEQLLTQITQGTSSSTTQQTQVAPSRARKRKRAQPKVETEKPTQDETSPPRTKKRRVVSTQTTPALSLEEQEEEEEDEASELEKQFGHRNHKENHPTIGVRGLFLSPRRNTRPEERDVDDEDEDDSDELSCQ